MGEGKERVADPQERLRGRLCMEGGPYKFKTRFYVGQFQHFLQPLLLTSKCLLITIIQGAIFSYREGVKHRLCAWALLGHVRHYLPCCSLDNNVQREY